MVALHHHVQVARDRQWLAGMAEKPFDADFRVENAGRIAGGAKDLVLVRPTERDIADHLGRHRQVRQHRGSGTDYGDASLFALGTMEVSHPEIAVGIERTAIAP